MNTILNCVIASTTSVKGWLPGKRDVAATFATPNELKAGIYTAELLLVDPARHEPLMSFAVKGASRAGVVLGEIEIGQ